jgi:hypothetical protein
LRAPFLQRSQLLPGTRGNMSHLFTLCRGVSFQKRSKPCCTTGRIFLVHTSLVWGPVIDPSHSPSFSAQRMPTPTLPRGSNPDIHPSRWSTQGPLADHPRHQWPWALRGPTHVHVFLQDIWNTVAECPLTCERKKIQMTFPSHSKSLGRHGFYGARITVALVISS